MKKCIYLVEDNDDIRELIELFLTDEKFEVHAHATVDSFKKEIINGRPDLIVLDVMLPDGNGIDVCSKLKADGRTKNVPVLMMSANADGSRVKAICKADEFIEKPFDIQDFVNKVYKYA